MYWRSPDSAPVENRSFSDTLPRGARAPFSAGSDCLKNVLRNRCVQQLRRPRFPYGQTVTLTQAGIDSTSQDDPLAPEPANLTGALIGYARVSTSGQNLDRQTRALTEVGCIRVFADKQSGKTADRPGLAACLDYLRAGDTLVVPSLDRLSRSLQDLITIVAGLRRRGTGFRSGTRRWTPPPQAAGWSSTSSQPWPSSSGNSSWGGRAARRRDQAAPPGSGAAGLACRAPDAQVRADLDGQRRVRGAAEDRELTQLRMPG